MSGAKCNRSFSCDASGALVAKQALKQHLKNVWASGKEKQNAKDTIQDELRAIEEVKSHRKTGRARARASLHVLLCD